MTLRGAWEQRDRDKKNMWFHVTLGVQGGPSKSQAFTKVRCLWPVVNNDAT